MPSAPSMYRHAPLYDDQIRVLTVHGSVSFDAIISCTLTPHYILTAEFLGFGGEPHYEALSYCWLDGCQDTRYILVNDQLFAISCSLQSALQYLRFEDRDRDVWIDALCINQADSREKSVQVPLMRTIYEKASGVLIWLGKSELLVGLFQAFHERLDSYTERTRRSQSRATVCDGGSPSSSTVSSHEDQDHDSDDLGIGGSLSETVGLGAGLYELALTRWFGRVWVVQEVCLAIDNPMVLCGSHSLPWDDFVAISIDALQKIQIVQDFAWVKPRRRQLKRMINLIRTLQETRVLWHLERYTSGCALSRQLQNNRARECSEAIDQIYGLLGICSTVSARMPFPIDYSQDQLKVSVSVTNHCIRWEENLNVLAAVYHNSEDISAANFEFANPSWTANWNEPCRSGSLTRFEWAGPAKPADQGRFSASGVHHRPRWEIQVTMITTHLETSDSGSPNSSPGPSSSSIPDQSHPVPDYRPPFLKYVLKVGGVRTGMRVRASFAPLLDQGEGPLEETMNMLRFLNFMRGWLQALRPRLDEAEICQEDFWHALCRDTRLHGVHDVLPDQYERMTDWLCWLGTRQEVQLSEKLARKLLQILTRLFAVMDGRVVFRASREDKATVSAFGLGPGIAAHFDEIVVLYGAQTPFMLRRVEGTDEYYLLGECYLHGLMDGEAVEAGRYEKEDFCLV